MGIQIPLRDNTEERIQAEIRRVAGDPSYAENAKRIQAIIRKTDGALNASQEIFRYLIFEQTNLKHKGAHLLVRAL